MEKLIELLNKYKKIKWYDWNTKITNYDTDTGSFTNGYSWLEYEIVIGKRYWFIQWLVDNEKIDKDKVELLSVFQETWWYYNLYQSLLMILSIQDEPINFLISILK